MKERVAGKNKAARHQPLGQQILEAGVPKTKARAKAGRKKNSAQETEFVDGKTTKKILMLAREQQDDDVDGAGPATATLQSNMSDSESEAEGESQDVGALYEQFNVQDEDEEALRAFMPTEAPQRMTLADMIMSKIKEKQTEIASQRSAAFDIPEDDGYKPPDPKVLQVYQSVGKILSKYRSGKLPKAFKIIPNLHNWEEILYITEPETWSAAAMFQATRIFASNLKAQMAQRFFNLVLFPRVRDDIEEYKKLNFHLYRALAKSLFKPGAFFKGILIPLCQSGDCTLREAVIIASIIARNSIPVLHASAAMLQIAELPYTGANSIFLRVLLDKKYALPYRVIDALVFHFYRFTSDSRTMPVLWHQCLLIFVQRYKEDITSEQKESLLALLRKHKHHSITDEIRREIVLSRSRDNEVPMEKEYGSGAAAAMEM